MKHLLFLSNVLIGGAAAVPTDEQVSQEQFMHKVVAAVKSNSTKIHLDEITTKRFGNRWAFVNTDGEELTFHGVNAVVKAPPYIAQYDVFDTQTSLTHEDFAYMRMWGINVIRLGYMWPGVQPHDCGQGKCELNPSKFSSVLTNLNQQNDEYTFTSFTGTTAADCDAYYKSNMNLEFCRNYLDMDYLNHVKHIVRTAGKYGIYTVLDMHQDVGAEVLCGEGVPNWIFTYAFDKIEKEFTVEPDPILPTWLGKSLAALGQDLLTHDQDNNPSVFYNLAAGLALWIEGLFNIKGDNLKSALSGLNHLLTNALSGSFNSSLYSSPSIFHGQKTFPMPSRNQCAKVVGGWNGGYGAELTQILWGEMFTPGSETNSAWANFWKRSAVEFNGFKEIIGFELVNEPWFGNLYQRPLAVLAAAGGNIPLLGKFGVLLEDPEQGFDGQASAVSGHLVGVNPECVAQDKVCKTVCVQYQGSKCIKEQESCITPYKNNQTNKPCYTYSSMSRGYATVISAIHQADSKRVIIAEAPTFDVSNSKGFLNLKKYINEDLTKNNAPAFDESKLTWGFHYYEPPHAALPKYNTTLSQWTVNGNIVSNPSSPDFQNMIDQASAQGTAAFITEAPDPWAGHVNDADASGDEGQSVMYWAEKSLMPWSFWEWKNFCLDPAYSDPSHGGQMSPYNKTVGAAPTPQWANEITPQSDWVTPDVKPTGENLQWGACKTGWGSQTKPILIEVNQTIYPNNVQQTIARPYASKLCGTVQANNYNHWTNTLTIQFQNDQSNCNVINLFLPDYQLPHANNQLKPQSPGDFYKNYYTLNVSNVPANSTVQIIGNSTGIFIDDSTQHTCPDTRHWSFQLGRCVPTCPAGQHNDDISGECVEDSHTCASGQVYDEKVKHCVPFTSLCDTRQHWSTSLNKCVDICPEGQYNDPNTGACVNCGAGEVFDVKLGKCVSVMSFCGGNQHWSADLNRCVDNCQTGEHNDPTTGTCIPDGEDCPPGQYWDENAKTCEFVPSNPCNCVSPQ